LNLLSVEQGISFCDLTHHSSCIISRLQSFDGCRRTCVCMETGN